MSKNIFEIDGDIEDEFDGEDQNGGDESENDSPITNANSDDEGAEVISVDNDENGDEIPWWDKYIEDGGEQTEGTAEPVAEIKEEVTPVVAQDIVEYIPEAIEDDIPEIIQDLESKSKVEEDEFGEDEFNSDDATSTQDEWEDDFEDEALDSEEPIEMKSEESFDELFPQRGPLPFSIATMVFAFLFLATLSLFGYYQFYDGEKFTVSFEHKRSSTLNNSDSIENAYSTLLLKSQKLQKNLERMTDSFRDANKKLLLLDTTDVGTLPKSSNEIDISEGTVYQIQMVALQTFKPNLDEANMKMFAEENNGMHKLLVGAFQDEDEAMKFNEALKKAGFSDVFIVKKVNGERVPYDPYK